MKRKKTHVVKKKTPSQLKDFWPSSGFGDPSWSGLFQFFFKKAGKSFDSRKLSGCCRSPIQKSLFCNTVWVTNVQHLLLLWSQRRATPGGVAHSHAPRCGSQVCPWYKALECCRKTVAVQHLTHFFLQIKSLTFEGLKLIMNFFKHF